MKLSYTYKLKLSVTMKEFRQYAIPLVPEKELKRHIKDELMQCARGIVNGDFGGAYLGGWETYFYRRLKNEGIISMTDEGYEKFIFPF